MNAQTQSAPVRHGRASTRATRNPSLTDKAGTVDPIMHDRLARRSQRHAAQRRPVEAERRIATLEALLHITQERMVADSLLLGTDSTHLPEPEPTYEPPAGHPEAGQLPLGAQDDVMLAGCSLDLWPNDEFEQIIAETKPVLAGPVFYCPVCGRRSSAGPCGCGAA